MTEHDEHDEFDLNIMQMAEPVLGAQIGQVVLKTHPRSQCEGRGIPCCIHDPSDHHMKTWEMNWRSDTGVMERFCPCPVHGPGTRDPNCEECKHHGVGHPDPDHMAYVLSLTPEHDCILEQLCNEGLNPVHGNAMHGFWLDEEEWCLYPHLEWQGVHGCDGCCMPS